MANMTTTDIGDVLKEIYPEGAPPEVVYGDSPLFALMEKDEGFEGELYKLPLVYGDPQGRSAVFTTAQTNQTAGKYEAFDLTITNDYGLCSIDGQVLDVAKSNKGSFVKALKQGMDGALRQLAHSAHHAAFRNGGGAIGQIASTATVASANLILSNPTDIRFFEVGQVIASDTTDGTSGAVNAGTATISAINRSTYTITTAGGNWSTQISGLATGDYLFVAGDFGAKMKGLDAWVPSSAPGATSFFGVDRSVDTDRLGGVRYDGSAQPIEEALIDGLTRVAENGGKPDVLVVHPRQFANLVKALGSKVNYSRRDSAMKSSTGATIGFRSVVVDGPTGPVDVLADLNCQPAVAWALQMDTWLVASCGAVPKMWDYDGQAYLRVYNADALELRCLYRAQIGCKAPGWNGRITLASL